MTNGLKYYKIKKIKNLLDFTEQVRKKLFAEMVDNATDPTIIKRRLRIIRHVNVYQNQLIKKIENFETDDINDLINFNPEMFIKDIINRSA